jgi:hypothetical protein
MNKNPVIPKKGSAPNIIIVNNQRIAKAMAIPQTNIAKIITKLPTFSPIAL